MQWKESTNEYIFVTMLCFCLKNCLFDTRFGLYLDLHSSILHESRISYKDQPTLLPSFALFLLGPLSAILGSAYGINVQFLLKSQKWP